MRVAVLKGGRSFERGVSLKSASRVEDSLRRRGHDVQPLDVGQDLVVELRRLRPDAAFVALHGAEGEDGGVQELLELLELPYTGSGPSACRRCWDKALAKYELVDAGLPTPDFVTFDQAAFADLGAADAMEAVAGRLDFPLVVKPARQGSALGIRTAASTEELPAALVGAFSYDTRVLLERFVAGRELAVSVVEGPGGARALPVVEAIPTEGGAYDFTSRYEIGATRFECPADLPADVGSELADVALRAFSLLGCRGFARVDFMQDRDSGRCEVLEVNSIPGLTETSLLPIAADAASLDFDEVVEGLVQVGVSRFSARWNN